MIITKDDAMAGTNMDQLLAVYLVRTRARNQHAQ